MFTTDRQLELQNILQAIPGVAKAYFQPPTGTEMQYPCIVYRLDGARTQFAGNRPYHIAKRYQVMVIHRTPKSSIMDAIAMLESAVFDRQYTVQNLYHSVFTLYF